MTDALREKPRLDSVEWDKTYYQGGDCCDMARQGVTVRQCDGGGGPFWVIETDRWSFESLAEFVSFLEEAGVK